MRTVLKTFVILVALITIGTTAVAAPLLPGVYTIQQQSNGRFVDAHESADNNFALVIRRAQNDDTQRWEIRPEK